MEDRIIFLLEGRLAFLKQEIQKLSSPAEHPAFSPTPLLGFLAIHPGPLVPAFSAVSPPSEVQGFFDYQSPSSGDVQRRKVSIHGKDLGESCNKCLPWLFAMLDLAHDSKEAKTAARMLLSCFKFTCNLRLVPETKSCGKPWDSIKSWLRDRLGALGEPLRQQFTDDKLQRRLGRMQLPLHTLVQGATEVRLDVPGMVPLPPTWLFTGRERNSAERSFIHVIKMVTSAINERFHIVMRKLLEAHVIADAGIMEMDKGNYQPTKSDRQQAR